MSMHPRVARATCFVAAAAATAGLVAACSGGSSLSGSSPSSAAAVGDPHVANVTITSERCVADRESYAAGGVTFKVSNKDATGVTEVEVLDGRRIIGEKENLPPGFSGTFAVNLRAGTYTVYCPGAATERTSLTVTGTARSSTSSDVSALLAQGTANYGGYIENQSALLNQNVATLAAALHGADLTAAQIAYDRARPYYERVEPVAESFQGLDPAIDARADDVPVTKLTGFHRIEYGLFAQKSLVGLAPIGDRLVVDCARLQTLSKGLKYQPAELANGAVELLDEVSKSKVTGEEERYSHIDLLDFQANVEGSSQAFANLQPALQNIDATLAAGIGTGFDNVLALLDTYRSKTDPSGFVRYQMLTKADITKLAQLVQAVAEPLSRVASKVVNG